MKQKEVDERENDSPLSQLKKERDGFDLKTTLIIILLIILAGLIFDTSSPLPSNCHLTSPVDTGGQEVECD